MNDGYNAPGTILQHREGCMFRISSPIDAVQILNIVQAMILYSYMIGLRV